MKKLFEADVFPLVGGSQVPVEPLSDRTKGKRRILIVDDDANSTHLVKILLERSGPYLVLEENDPTKADEVAHDFKPDVSLCGGGEVSGPGWTMEALPTPGHTSNHLCYALKEENALFSGDHIMGWSTPVVTPPDGDMADYMASLERIKTRGFNTMWPTHGPPILQVTGFIDA